MKKLLSALIASLFLSPAVYAGICDVKPEAESKKNTLPVKYRKLAAKNASLAKNIEMCKDEKKLLEDEIVNLKAKISALEVEKTTLTRKLSTYPPKWELESRIRQLEEKLGR